MCEEIARIFIIFCRHEKVHFQYFDGTRNGNVFCALVELLPSLIKKEKSYNIAEIIFD